MVAERRRDVTPVWRVVLLSGLLCGLAACSARPPAPVVERSTGARQQIPVDGLHRVRSGDSLHSIAFRYGLDYRDIAAWNDIRAPYLIYPDQLLRLRASAQVTAKTPQRPSAVVTTQAAPAATARTQDAPPPGPRENPQRQDNPPAKPASQPPAAKPDPPRPASASADPPDWAWPVEGRISRTFKPGDPARNGLDIVGREGQPVRATAAGEVVYSGSGLIGYGELVIIKHSDRMLSAYGHNRRRLVAEGDRVRQGQAVAELGRNDRNEAVVHFEIRRDGKPVDPLGYLPKP